MESSSTAPAPRKSSRRRRLAFALLTLTLILLFGVAAAEVVCRVLEGAEAKQRYVEGPGGRWVPHESWGWRPSVGDFREGTAEFAVTGKIDARFMNGPPDLGDASAKRRILCLGDSHTYAVGASWTESWPSRLQERLNASSSATQVYNAAVSGYSLHQYLLRLIDQGPDVRPQHVIVGLSYATDLYDLLPPHAGGWTYGEELERDYFDLEGDTLVRRHWRREAAGVQVAPPAAPAGRLRAVLQQFATFRRLRRSGLALWVGSHLSVGGRSLWPNMEVIFKREPTAQHAYAWRLAEALLGELRAEAARHGAELIVVGIPYLPQVYDDLWDATFAGDPTMSRTAAIDRVRRWCDAHGVSYVDVLEPMRARAAEQGRWVHWPRDAHPTPEGQDVIAETIVRAKVLE